MNIVIIYFSIIAQGFNLGERIAIIRSCNVYRLYVMSIRCVPVVETTGYVFMYC